MVTVTSLNAADYGLVSGSADQTAHLQAAINAAQTQGLPLFIPKGTFPITQVDITAPVRIYSTDGGAVFPDMDGHRRSISHRRLPATGLDR